MRLFITISLIIFSLTLKAQTVAGFENLGVPENSFLDGSDGSGGFASGNVFIANDYNTAYSFWSGWAISSTTDTVTAGIGNQYSAFPGEGAEGSETYGLTYAFNPVRMSLTNDALGEQVNGIYISNSTWGVRSMQSGDAYAKQFGGPTGDDPDFFLLTIKKYYQGQLSTDSVDFYLADYRFDDNSEDYILTEWAWADLTSLGSVDSLHFRLTSSDTGVLGMNTPAYFCVDNVTTSDGITATKNLSDYSFELFPNPTADYIQFRTSAEGKLDYVISNNVGQVLRIGESKDGFAKISLEGLAEGIYWISIFEEGAILGTEQILKMDN